MDSVRYTQVELHINTSPDFPRRYGERVKACGGKYSECRGYKSNRYVHLPADQTDLIDAIVRDYRTGKTTMIAREIEGAGFNLPTWAIVHHWTPKSGMAPSELLAKEFRSSLERMDWTQIRARQREEAERQAARQAERDRSEEIAGLKDDIAAEALKLLDGKNDIGDLKLLAARLRELGWTPKPDEEREAAGPTY